MCDGKLRESLCAGKVERGIKDQHRIRVVPVNARECGVVFRSVAHAQSLKLKPQGCSRRLDRLPTRSMRWCCRVPDDSNARNPWKGLRQQFQSLTLVSGSIEASPVTFPPGRARLTTWPLSIGAAWVMKMMGIVEVARLAASA